MTRQGVVVRDLIRDTEWHPSQDYDSAKPVVSVLLPTFRRGASGLFLKAALSVLGQSLPELELIIVDDGSSDGTAAQIDELMRRDPRVSCLRHPRNVGLPAVSEYEAYTKARADYLAFAFDDDEFHPDAIERLFGFAQARGHAIVHGHVEVQSWDDRRGEAIRYPLGRGGAAPTVLRVANAIANNSVLLHRRVVETVGFFDPHVAIARLCDWDLWRRTAAAYRIVAADIPVGIVGGPGTRDSLEHTYPLDLWLSHEWCDRPRNARLLPGAIEDYDVLETPATLSCEAALALDEIRRWHSKRWWFPRETSAPGAGAPPGSAVGGLPGGRVLVVTGSHDASTTLYFDHLPDEVRARVRLVYPGAFHPQEMIGASAVVFVRHLTNIAGLLPWIELAARLGVPHYYFLDDNFIVLSKEPEHRDELGEYTPDWVRDRLRSFAGVLLSTESLREYFRRERLHETLFLYPPIAQRPRIEDADAFARKVPGALRVAFFGGAHRVGPFVDVVVPALARAAREFPLEVVAGGSGEGLGALSQAARVLTVPFETSYDVALSRFANAEIDVLCHPNSETANNPFKTLNVLISAWAMGAVPILSDGPPYDQLRGEDVAVLCPNASEAWLRALRGLRRDPASRRRTSERLDRYCRTHFGGQENVKAIRSILQAHAPAGLVIRDARARRAMELLRDPVPAAAPPSPPVPASAPVRVIADPVMRAPARAQPGKVALRIPVGRACWCGVDVDVGAGAPPPEAGEYVARLLAAGGGCLRQTWSLPGDGRRGWLGFRFPSVANSTGHEFDLEITAPGAEPHAAWSGLRSASHVAYRLLFEV